MTTLAEAIRLANEDIKAGHAIQHRMFDGELCVFTDQGWQVVWPNDPEPNPYDGM